MSDDNLQWREINYDLPESEGAYHEKVRIVDANIWEKVEKTGRKISFVKDIRALYSYMKDPGVEWYRKGIVVAALLYFISPIDAMPDFVPIVGYLDDLGVIVAVLKFLGSELVPYYD